MCWELAGECCFESWCGNVLLRSSLMLLIGETDLNNTGSLFYLTSVVCYFTPLFQRACVDGALGCCGLYELLIGETDLNNTGSSFYLTSVVCYFTPLFQRACVDGALGCCGLYELLIGETDLNNTGSLFYLTSVVR